MKTDECKTPIEIREWMQAKATFIQERGGTNSRSGDACAYAGPFRDWTYKL